MSDVDFIGAHLVPSPGQLLRLQKVAAGAEPADLAVRDGTVLALHGREMLRRDVLICGPHIAAVTPPGRLAANSEIDAAGRWVSPGFIDTHLHIEYTLLTPGELARLVVPRGTTTVLADPNCLAQRAGTGGNGHRRHHRNPAAHLPAGLPQGAPHPRTRTRRRHGARGRDPGAPQRPARRDPRREQPLRSGGLGGPQVAPGARRREAHHRPQRPHRLRATVELRRRRRLRRPTTPSSPTR